jgi:hypothetical protein
MKLTDDKSDVHIDQSKKANIISKENIDYQTAEKAHEKASFISFYKSSGSHKNHHQIRHNTAKIQASENSSLQNERKQHKYEISYKTPYFH